MSRGECYDKIIEYFNKCHFEALVNKELFEPLRSGQIFDILLLLGSRIYKKNCLSLKLNKPYHFLILLSQGYPTVGFIFPENSVNKILTSSKNAKNVNFWPKTSHFSVPRGRNFKSTLGEIIDFPNCKYSVKMGFSMNFKRSLKVLFSKV